MSRNKHIYNTARWQRTRARKLRETPLCEYCPPESRRPATEVDHFKAISDGGAPYDMANLRSACKSCHSQKTAHGETLHGCDENGMPRDPRHGWNTIIEDKKNNPLFDMRLDKFVPITKFYYVKTLNVLFAANIHTVGELLNNTTHDLMRKKNCGKKIVDFIVATLGEHGLQLADEREKDIEP